MGASYAETFFFDLIVVFFVAIVMPISVLLLRSNSTPGKLGGATLLGLSVLYVGGFEHYRLHAPEARWLGLCSLFYMHNKPDASPTNGSSHRSACEQCFWRLTRRAGGCWQMERLPWQACPRCHVALF